MSMWRKSSRSVNGQTCVEVVGSLDAVRDSKNPGVALRADVGALVRAVRSGVVDRGRV
jgi:uncharacterized protein DUF397